MRNLFIALCLSLSLAGCGSNPFAIHDISKETVKEDPVRAGQMAIDNANAAIIAIARSVIDNYLAGAIDIETKNNYYNTLAESAKRLDEAQELLIAGEVVMAKSKVEIAQEALDWVRAELIKLANKENQ